MTERVVAVNPEAKQLKVELHTYDGKTVVLAVGDEALGRCFNWRIPREGITEGSLDHDRAVMPL